MKQSSKDILKRHGWRLDKAVHNFVYFYFHTTYVKVSILLTKVTVTLLGWFKPAKFVPHFVFDRYHSKVLSKGDITKILSLDQDLVLGPDKKKQVLPFKYANNIIIRNPKLIAVMDCPCTLNREKPYCQPVAKCIAIGQDFAPIWLEHCQEKYNARQVTQEEALEIIRQARETGHVTQSFLKVATGGLTGIVCNCCPKCCAEMECTNLSKKLDQKISQYAPSGYSVKREAAKCDLCGKCRDICPFDAIQINGEQFAYDKEACMGCELCVEHCPTDALSLFRDTDKLLPMDIDLLKDVFAETSS